MSIYLVKTPHRMENCLQTLDSLAAKGQQTLEKFVFACNDGDHTGYAIVETDTRNEAFNLVPDFLRSEAKVWQVDRFTPNLINLFHAKAA
jgi:hypothetical protein